MFKLDKVLLAAALLLVPVAAQAETPQSYRFERNGVVYEYEMTKLDGKTILTGTANGHSPFRLVVVGDRVRGNVNGRMVSFARPKVAKRSEATTLAAR